MQFILLIGLILTGFALAKAGWITQKHINWGNKYIIYVALPVVALAKIPGLVVTSSLTVLVFAPVGILLLSLFLFQIILRRFLSKEERLVLALTSGLGNTSFVGFPLIVFYFGSESLSYGALFDQVTFLLMASVGQAMIVKREGWSGLWFTVKKVISFPVFVVILISFLIPADFFGGIVLIVFDWIIQSLSIVAMVIVGYLIAKYVTFPFPRKIVWGLSYKLVIAPLLVVLLVSALQLPSATEKVMVLESAMAPQTSICLMLLDHNKLPHLVSQILCWGTVISLFTSYVWVTMA